MHRTPDCDGKVVEIGTLTNPGLVKCTKCRATWLSEPSDYYVDDPGEHAPPPRIAPLEITATKVALVVTVVATMAAAVAVITRAIP